MWNMKDFVQRNDFIKTILFFWEGESQSGILLRENFIRVNTHNKIVIINIFKQKETTKRL